MIKKQAVPSEDADLIDKITGFWDIHASNAIGSELFFLRDYRKAEGIRRTPQLQYLLQIEKIPLVEQKLPRQVKIFSQKAAYETIRQRLKQLQPRIFDSIVQFELPILKNYKSTRERQIFWNFVLKSK